MEQTVRGPKDSHHVPVRDNRKNFQLARGTRRLDVQCPQWKEAQTRIRRNYLPSFVLNAPANDPRPGILPVRARRIDSSEQLRYFQLEFVRRRQKRPFGVTALYIGMTEIRQIVVDPPGRIAGRCSIAGQYKRKSSQSGKRLGNCQDAARWFSDGITRAARAASRMRTENSSFCQ